MKYLLRIPLYSLIAAFSFCAILALFGVGDKPDVIGLGWSLTPADIDRAKKILYEGSKVKPDELGTIELTESDLNLAANYLLSRYLKSAVSIQLKNNKLRFNVTATLPENFLGKYLNISFRLGNDNIYELPGITKFKVGKLLLPAKFAAFVIETVIHNTALNNYLILATKPIKAVQIDDYKIKIIYKSNVETLQKAKYFLTASTTTNPAQEVYQKKLGAIIAKHDPEWRLSLAELLQPMFELAYKRSTPETAIEENRLAIFTVNEYVNRLENQTLLPQSSSAAKEHYYAAFMYKRIDLAQHFIVSAAITASLNGQLAEVVGEQKELSDANGGSGFSFIDLAADKAGTRFGELATSTPESARKIQKAMSGIKSYSDFMPDPRDLPDKMNAEQFKERFGTINSPAYLEISKQIDARITAMPLYQLK